MKWPRIHRSTKVLFYVLVASIALFNLASHTQSSGAFTHGWPFTYLTNQVNSFHWAAFCANALIALALSGIVAAACEFHLRKYGSFRRFGTGSLLLVMALIAILFSLFGPQSVGSLKQAAAIRRLEQAGSQIQVTRQPTRFRALYELIDPRLGGVPQNIDVQDADLRDERLLSAAAFRDIDRLSIQNSLLSDRSYEEIGKFKQLRILIISHTKGIQVLGNQNLQALGTLAHLESLEFNGLDLRAVDFRAFDKMNSLTVLNLNHSIVSDSQLEAIAKLPALEEISLHGMAITDAGLVQFVNCKTLRGVAVHDTSVTNAGFEILLQAKPRLSVLYSSSLPSNFSGFPGSEEAD